jgi:hypothetical protein
MQDLTGPGSQQFFCQFYAHLLSLCRRATAFTADHLAAVGGADQRT